MTKMFVPVFFEDMADDPGLLRRDGAPVLAQEKCESRRIEACIERVSCCFHADLSVRQGHLHESLDEQAQGVRRIQAQQEQDWYMTSIKVIQWL